MPGEYSGTLTLFLQTHHLARFIKAGCRNRACGDIAVISMEQSGLPQDNFAFRSERYTPDHDRPIAARPIFINLHQLTDSDRR